MDIIELRKRVENPQEYWPIQCGFPEGVHSYSEFCDAMKWFNENSATFNHVVFRGEPRYYKTFCKPSVARINRELTKNMTKGHIITDQEVESVLIRFGDYNGSNILFHSQHFGSPTRLLDVSNSPEVALYFACNSYFDEDGYIYLVFGSTTIPMWGPNASTLDDLLTYYDFMTRNDVCYLLDSYNLTKRIQAQFGSFLCWKNPQQEIPGPVYVIKIKNLAKKRIINEIESLGWQKRRLFPDLYGEWLERLSENS